MANAIINLHRQRYPNDPRTDDELTLGYGASASPSDLANFPDFVADYQRLASPENSLALTESDRARIGGVYPVTAPDYVRQAVGEFGRGIGGTISSMLRGIGTIARRAGRQSAVREGEQEIVPSPEPGAVEMAPMRIAEAMTPAPVEGLKDSFLATTVPNALGSSVGFLAGGALTGGLAVPELAGVAALGALSGFQQGWDDAKQKGASDDVAWSSALLNGGIGTSEAVPLGKILKRLDGLSGHTLREALAHAATESFEEAVQEAFQGVSGNVIANRILKYDKDRETYDGVLQQGGAGGISGALVSLASSLIGAKVNALRQRQAAGVPTPAAQPTIEAPFPDVAGQYGPSAVPTPLTSPTIGMTSPTIGAEAPSNLPFALQTPVEPITTEVPNALNTGSVAESGQLQHLGTDAVVQAQGENRIVPPEVQGQGSEAGGGNRPVESPRRILTPEEAAEQADLRAAIQAEAAAKNVAVATPVVTTQQAVTVPSAVVQREPVAAHPFVDTIDWSQPLEPTPSAQGRSKKSGELSLTESAVTFTSGEHRGKVGTLVHEGPNESGTPTATVLLEDTGEEVVVPRGTVKKLKTIRDQVRAEQGQANPKDIQPAYFEITVPPKTESDLEALVSRASPTAREVTHGSANTWTHRFTAFLKNGKVFMLPTYKADTGTIRVGMPSGSTQGVLELIGRGYKPLGSFRRLAAYHAKESAKETMSYDEYLQRIETPAKDKLGSDRAFAATIPIATAVESGTKGEPVIVGAVAAQVPAELVVSNRVADPLYTEITAEVSKNQDADIRDSVVRALVIRGQVDERTKSEIQQALSELFDTFGETSKAYEYLVNRVTDAYQNAGTSQNFAKSLSGSSSSGVAKGIVSGLSGAEVNRVPGTVAAREITPTVGSNPAVDAGQAASHPRARVGSGGEGARGDSNRAGYRRVLDILALNGIDVHVIQQNVDAINDFYQRSGAGVSFGNSIAVVLKDITNPTHDDLVTLLHELSEQVLAGETQETRDLFNKVITQISNADLRTNLSSDVDIRNRNLPPDVLGEELLNESIAVQLARGGFAEPKAQSLARKFVRFLRDLYNRVSIAVQSALFGREHVNPSRAREYFLNRVESFIAGDVQPISFLNFIGGGKPNVYRTAQYYAPYDGLVIPVRLEPDGSYHYQDFNPDTLAAALQNIENAVSVATAGRRGELVEQGGPRLTSPVTVAEEQPIGGENPGASKEVDFAANRKADEVLHKVFSGYQTHPEFPKAEPPTFEQFFGQLTDGDVDLPSVTNGGVQAHLQQIGAQPIDPMTQIETLVNDSAATVAQAKALGKLQKFSAGMSRMVQESARVVSSATNKLQRLISREELWWNRFTDLDFLFTEAKISVREMLSDFKGSVRGQIKGARSLGMIEQQLNQIDQGRSGRVSQRYEKVIDRMAQRVFDNNVRFTDFMRRTYPLQIDWANLTMPQIKERLLIALANDPFLKGLDTDETNAAIAIVASFAKSNASAMAWLDVKESNDTQAVDAIKALLKEARVEMNDDLRLAQQQINKLPRLKVQAQRILDKYRQIRLEAKSTERELRQAQQFLHAANIMAPVMQQEMNRLETAIGAEYPVTVQHGARLPIPVSNTQSDESISRVWEGRDPNHDPIQFSQTSTPQEIKSLYDRTTAWLEANRERGGAMWTTMNSVDRQLRMWNATRGQQALKQGVLGKIFGSASDLFQGTGARAGYEAAKMLRDFVVKRTSFYQPHQVLGEKDSVALGDAMNALGMKSQGTFLRLFRDNAYKYFEMRKDLMAGKTEAQAEHAVLQAWRMELMADPVTKDRINSATWAALDKFYKAEFAQARKFAETKTAMGTKVKDPFLGLSRELLGQVPFVMPRGLRLATEGLYDSMKTQWAGTSAEQLNAQTISQQFSQDPQGLAQSLQPRFTPRVWKEFVGPLANRPGISVFSGERLGDGATWTRASVENTRRAFRESTDPVGFALRLAQLENVNQNDLPEFIGETIETFQNYYNSIEAALRESEHSKSLWGVEPGSPRYLSDARISEEWPAEWIEYRGMDQNSARAGIERMAFESAFGRNGEALAQDLNNAQVELESAEAEWNATRERVEHQNPEATGQKLLNLVRKDLTAAGRPVKFIENAHDNLATLRATRESMKSWLKAQYGDLVEAKVFLEALQTMTGFMVQGPKSGFINTIDLLMTPLLELGVSRQALSLIRRNLSSFANNAAGSHLQTIGYTLQSNAENQRRRNELGQRDSDNDLTLKEQVRAQLYADLGLQDRPKAQSFVRATRIARLFTRAGIPARTEEALYPTLKPAAFTMFSKWMNDALIDGTWFTTETAVRKAVEYLRAHPDEIGNPALNLTAENLGYKDGWIYKDAEAFRNLKSNLEEWGMRLENLARDAMKPGVPLLSKDSYRNSAVMALNIFSLESSISTSPRWLENPGIRFMKPLLAWSLAKTNALRRVVTGPEGELNKRTLLAGLYALASTIPIGLAYAFLTEKYDEKLLGKKSNVRGPSEYNADLANDFMAFVEQNARLGSFGLWGDMANTVLNFGGGGDLRGISLDSRIVFMNSLMATANAVNTWAHQGEADYQGVLRPLLQAAGGSGYLQYAEILNNMLSLDNAEARVTSRINVANWLRSVGRTMDMDVKVVKGGPPDTQATPVTPAIANMILSAYANNASDFMDAYRDAVDAAREVGKPDPTGYVRRAYAAHNPLRTVFRTPPSESEYRQILSNLPDAGREAVSSGINLLNRYGEMIGAETYTGKTEREKQSKPASLESASAIRTRALSSFLGGPRLSLSGRF